MKTEEKGTKVHSNKGNVITVKKKSPKVYKGNVIGKSPVKGKAIEEFTETESIEFTNNTLLDSSYYITVTECITKEETLWNKIKYNHE